MPTVEVIVATESYWRKQARDTIWRVIEKCPHLADAPYEMLDHIDKAYPFGMRKHLPYKMWLEERRKAMGAITTDPMFRVCPTCGASIVKNCRPVGVDDDLIGSQMVLDDARKSFQPSHVISELAMQAMHASRRQHLVKPKDNELPLFSGVP